MEKRLAQKFSLINIGRKNAAVDDTHFRNIWLFKKEKKIFLNYLKEALNNEIND